MTEPRQSPLTLHEKTILDRLARGHTPKQARYELILGKTSWAVALRVIKAKLGAKTTPHAVAIAIEQKMIYPLDGGGEEGEE